MMLSRFVGKYLVASILSAVSCIYSESMLTPFRENIPLAVVSGDTITEYQVFGYPSTSLNRREISFSERKEDIDNYIIAQILQKEGDKPTIRNSEDYKRNYSKLLSKNSAEYLREKLINEEFITPSMIEEHRSRNMGDSHYASSEESELESMISEIRNAKKQQINNFIRSYLDSLIQAYKVEYNEEFFTKVSSLKAESSEEFAESLLPYGLNTVIVSYGERTVTVKKLYDDVKNIKPYHINHLSSVSVLKSMTDGDILNSILVKEAEKRGIPSTDYVKQKTEDQMKYFIASRYKDVLLADANFVPEKEEVLDYYINNKDDRSLWSRRKMWVYEIFRSYDNSDEIEENDKIKVAIELENIRQKIISGEEEFEKYAKFYSRPGNKDGVLGYIFEDDYAMIGKTAFKMNSGEISDLIIQEKAISVIKVDKVQEPALYKFDYVEELIKRRLIDEKKRQFFHNYKKDLFKKYKVEYISSTNGVLK
ncbi:MAG: peptidylprolyl isomerase [Candidatus Delongbacteria bacterium]|nr:peptidylprolyl isomerase [Candidatus Delongbacteria bacterium]